MQTANRVALKEWAVVCAALADGRQTILLRKGGIAEGAAGFTARHRQFWLFATRFHQSADELIEAAHPLLREVQADAPPAGIVRLPLYVTVRSVLHIDTERLLPRLEGSHILAPETVASRFHYRRPGLFVLTVRACRPPEPVEIPDSPHFAGCHSWVDLPAALPTGDLTPVLTDDEFAPQAEAIERLLGTRTM